MAEWWDVGDGSERYAVVLGYANPDVLVVRKRDKSVVSWRIIYDVPVAGPFKSIDAAKAAMLIMLEAN